jgi:hypothetical protein
MFLLVPYFTFTFSFQEGNEKSLMVAAKTVAGAQHYNFKLSAWHPKGGKWNFAIRSVPTSEEHKGQLVYFPLWALPWLREQMVTILLEVDPYGSKLIDKMPTIPEWATRGFLKLNIIE